MNSERFLEARNVSITYGRGRKAVNVLSDISFNVKRGELVPIIGPSGSGKSTLAKAISGHLEISGGELLLDGHHIREPGPDRFFIHQTTEQLLPWMTIEKNVAYPLIRRGVHRREAMETAREWLGRVGIRDQACKYPAELSGGQKQRASVARGFASSPALLIMDESFSALDEINRAILGKLTKTLQRETGTTIIMITHSIEEAVELGDRVIVLASNPGRIKAIIDINGQQDHIQELRELINT